MSEPIEIGMLCGKGDGHALFVGEYDHGMCDYDKVGTFTLALNVQEGETVDQAANLKAGAEYIARAIEVYSKSIGG